MSKPQVRPATPMDCVDLAVWMREEDQLEIAHASGRSPLEALILGFKASSEVLTVHRGDEVIAVFGVGGIPGRLGVPWMLATDALRSIRKEFVKECRGYVERMLREYGHLENRVWAKNTTHIVWLRWLGFTFDPAAPYGVSGEPFHRFYMSNQNV